MTLALIDALSRDLRPVARLPVLRRLLIGLGVGAAISGLLSAATLGLRADMAEAVRDAMFWVKLSYTVASGALALWSCERLARPGSSAGRRWPWLLVPLLLLVGLAVWQLANAPAPMRGPMLMGPSHRVCLWCIPAFSVPPLCGLVWAARGLAPTRLRLTGAMLGLTAGGAGATMYALHCEETAAPFLAAWYTAGMALAAGVGWMLGPRLLRW